MKPGIEVEDVCRCDTTAGTVDRKHRLAFAVFKVPDVFCHRSAPVGQVDEVDAGLVCVDGHLDGQSSHGLLAGKEQVEIISAASATFLDDFADSDAQVFPSMFLFNVHVGDELADRIHAQGLADLVDGQAHVAWSQRSGSCVD